MPVYPDLNLIFIHIPKTAGGTIERLLEPHKPNVAKTLINRLLSKTPVSQNVTRAYIPGHSTAQWHRRKLGEALYSSLTSFTVVRNPYDRMISHYEFIRQTERHHRHQAYKDISFESFLAKRNQDHMSQLAFLTAPSGEVIVDHIFKFETIHEELNSFFEQRGMTERLGEDKGLNTSKKRARESYLTPEAIAFINEKAAEDFDALEYEKLGSS